MTQNAKTNHKFEKIFPALRKVSGIDFSLYKVPTVSRAIERRMAAVSRLISVVCAGTVRKAPFFRSPC
jgi:hypothetical protein